MIIESPHHLNFAFNQQYYMVYWELVELAEVKRDGDKFVYTFKQARKP